VNCFGMLEDAALQSRVGRLKVEEQGLAERVAKQMAALETANRWHKSDPLYQRLSSVHRRVREDLRNAEQELARRAQELPRRGISTTTQRARRTSYTQVIGRLLERSRARGRSSAAYQA